MKHARKRHAAPSFEAAALYAQLTAAPGRAVLREQRRTGLLSEYPRSERYLKCVWYDPAFRPAALHTDMGEEVKVENPGIWNLEPGPDFLDAVITVGPEMRRMCGDVEIHIRPSDWNAHGHKSNPDYSRIIAHVCYFKGRLPAESLPPAAVQMALAPDLAANPFFSFESIDLSAYPHAVLPSPSPCSMLMSRWDETRIRAFLLAAGQARLKNKAERMAAAVETDPDQALYEETMAALGYKHNRHAFRRLARLVPVSLLRELSGLDPVKAYAVLAGAAGLLPGQMSEKWDAETKLWLRRLWDVWWKHSSSWASRGMIRAEWRLSGLRPQNHPARRLMAAAVLFCGKEPISARLKTVDFESGGAWRELLRILSAEPGAENYWSRRLAVGGPKTRAAVALVGERRAAEIIANVVMPFLTACGARLDENITAKIPAEQDNALLRRAAAAFFGPDHNPAVYAPGILRQGLIQAYQDFCLNDRSACAACPLPATLARLNA